MKPVISTETTLTLKLSHTEIGSLLRDHLKAIPSDWTYCSIEVKGKGVSEGAEFIVKCSQSGHSIPKP